MKRKLSITVSALFVLTITALLLKPTVVNAFWYGSKNPPMVIAPFNGFVPQDLHDSLMNGPISQLRMGFFAFNNNPDEEENVTIYDPDKAWNGYTLLGLLQGKLCEGVEEPYTDEDVCGSVLIDMDGEIVKEWRLLGFPAKMLPGGSVMGGEIPFHQLTGVPLVQMDWCGNEEWRWDGNADDRWFGPAQVDLDPAPC